MDDIDLNGKFTYKECDDKFRLFYENEELCVSFQKTSSKTEETVKLLIDKLNGVV